MNSIFPDPRNSDEDGLLCFSRNLTCEMLLDAYSHGIFPWPINESFIPWASPKKRGILPVDRVHISKSLKRDLRHPRFTVTADRRFATVILSCATAERPNQDGVGSWITGKMIRAYCQFHKRGYAHSFEAFNEQGELVGGLYGVVVGKVFCGESMFYRESGASKIAFCRAVDAMKAVGIELIDTQMVTNLTASFGAYEVPQEEYLSMLERLGDVQPTPGLFDAVNAENAV